MLIDPEGYIAHQVSGEGQLGLSRAGDRHAALGARREGDARARSAARRASGLPPRTGLRFPGKVAHDPERGLLAVADTGHHRIVLLDGAGMPCET